MYVNAINWRTFTIFILFFFVSGCETVHKSTKQAGTYVGKGIDAVGGVTEGAAEGYKGSTENAEENPYGR